VLVTNDLLEDADGLDAYQWQAVGARLDFRVTDWLVNGHGVDQPLGGLNSPLATASASPSSAITTSVRTPMRTSVGAANQPLQRGATARASPSR